MCSRPWSNRELQKLYDHAGDDEWFDAIRKAIPRRSDASLRGRMMKVREELGLVEPHDSEARFRANAVNGTRALLDAIERARLRP